MFGFDIFHHIHILDLFGFQLLVEQYFLLHLFIFYALIGAKVRRKLIRYEKVPFIWRACHLKWNKK